jgi:hypothetical protein
MSRIGGLSWAVDPGGAAAAAAPARRRRAEVRRAAVGNIGICSPFGRRDSRHLDLDQCR